MSTNRHNTAVAKSTRKRRRLIEKLYLDGYGPLEIADRLPKQHRVQYGTVRKDIVEIRKAWVADIDAMDEFEGRHRYLARTRDLRRKADRMEKLELAHTLDKEIARLSGVNLKADDLTWQITLTAAVARIDDVMTAVFSVVTDHDTQEQIIDAIEAIAD